MYLPLQAFLSQKVSFADLFGAALSHPRTLPPLLDDGAREEKWSRQLQQMSSAGPILLDLDRADGELSNEEIEQMTYAIRKHWHEHGFCIIASADPARWRQAAFRANQPLLHWQSLTPHAGWDLLGYQYRAREREVFRLLVEHGRVTAEQIARNPLIFSQHPNVADGRVLQDLILLRPLSPGAFNRDEARRILRQMRERRLVVQQGYFSCIVRPERDLLARQTRRER